MSENPAIHRHPSGDIDIALPLEEPDPGPPASEDMPTNQSVDSAAGRP